MKRVTILIAAAAAALAMTAAAGAGTASADTVLCSKPVTTCAPENVLPSGTWLTTGSTFGESFVLELGNEDYISCEFDIAAAQTTAEKGNPLPATFGGSVYAHRCFNHEYETSCNTTSLNSPKASVEATGGGDGVLKIGSASEPLTLTIKCGEYPPVFGNNTCVFKATGVVTMSLAGAAVVNSAPMTRSAGSVFWCSGEALNLDIQNYVDSATYISSI